MRKIFILLFVIPFCAVAQDIDSTWVVNNYTKKEVMIPMRDGVKLFTTIYAPKDASEMHPILLQRTPYSCAPYGESNFAQVWSKGYPRKYFFKENKFFGCKY